MRGGLTLFACSSIKTSPVVIDFNNDGYNEVIFGDKFGFVRMLDMYGNEIEDNVFPFDTGDEIWGSPAAGYIDGDNKVDLVVTSKSKHVFVLDMDGEKLDYNANQFLIGTPALGNLDDDEDLEVGNTSTFLNEYVDSMPEDNVKTDERKKVKKLLQVIYDEALNIND